MKMGLGTAQFGLDYGISNTAGKTPLEEVRRILAEAARRGLRVLDTARLYGDSEAALGRALPDDHPFRIVTKTPKFPAGFDAAAAFTLQESLAASLKTLRIPSAYGLLAHDADDLIRPGGDRMLATLRELKSKGLAAKVGASVYTGAQIEALLSRGGVDLVQVPCNVLDQRLIDGGHLRALKSAGVEVHCRSVFLQGLLLMDPPKVPRYFDPIRPVLEGFRAASAARGLTLLQAALAFVAGRPEIDHFLVGVNDLAQLREILSAAESSPGGAPDFSLFKCEDERFVNPALWKTA